MSIVGSLIGGLMILQVEIVASTVATDSGRVAIASVCLARMAAPVKIGVRHTTLRRGIAASGTRCIISWAWPLRHNRSA